uniref:Uncharacterized protein n=1 Tax=Glossina palpalis gambiensis TaxID=67801 RepID=A0A1B0BJ23_9MUSC
MYLYKKVYVCMSMHSNGIINSKHMCLSLRLGIEYFLKHGTWIKAKMQEMIEDNYHWNLCRTVHTVYSPFLVLSDVRNYHMYETFDAPMLRVAYRFDTYGILSHRSQVSYRHK